MTLRTRLLLALSYVLVLAVVALLVPLALNLRDRVEAEVRAEAGSQADLVAATAAQSLARGRRGELARVAGDAAQSVRGRVIVVDARGRVVADSAGGAQVGTSYASRPEIAAALRGRPRQLRRTSRTLDAQLLATAVPVVQGGRVVGAARITQSVAAVDRAVRRVTLELALVGVVVLALGLAAGAFIAAQVSRPTRRLEQAARRIAAGDLSARAPVEGSREQRSLAESFNDMTARLGRALEAQRRFVADASHALRTPLTGLRLRLEGAREEVDGEAREDLAAGLEEVDRLAELVDDLLVLSRAGEHERPAEPCAVAGALERARRRWSRLAEERGLALVVDAGGAGVVRCAPSDLDRALDPLVENALRYAPAGGEVVLAGRADGVDVLDRGPGVAAGEAEQVFERFHRGGAGRRIPGGTGLGLPIARALARAWDGEVTLRPRAGGGTVAVLRLPRARERGGERAPASGGGGRERAR